METRLDARFSEDGAKATPWEKARGLLETAEVSWLTTVRADGRPHVTTLLTVWVDDAVHFTTGPGEQKGVNLAAGPYVAVTTGTNQYASGLDVVVEGVASRVTDAATLKRVAAAYETKYGAEWRFDVQDNGTFHNSAGGEAYVYRVVARQAFGFAKGVFGQTRWRF